MHDRELAAQKELWQGEIRRLDEESATQVTRLTENLTALRGELVTAQDQRNTAQILFEDAVALRFVENKDFREALDLLKGEVATRTELDKSLGTVKDETATALTAAKVTTDQLTKDLSDLRSRIDVGPENLRTLQDRSNQNIGAQRRGAEITASMIGIAGVSVILLAAVISTIVALILHG